MLKKTVVITLLASLLLSQENTKDTSEDKIKAYTKFRDAVSIVKKYYVDDKKIDEIVDKAIRGMLSNLDAHSSYMDEKEYKELTIQTSGKFSGLGMNITTRKGVLTVVSPLEGTPAERAGIKSGDYIVEIDGKSTFGMSADVAANLMRGKAKTKVVLTIIREDEKEPKKLTLIRDNINIKLIYTKSIEDSNVFYVRINSFGKGVGKKLKDALKHNKDKKGVILDLRNNPGGLLSEAIEIVDLFVEKGVIVSQKSKNPSENTTYKAHKEGTFKNLPVTVLINRGSASASEIVSGALQDHKRAILIGTKTFGKGSVQTMFPVGNGVLKLTIARYYLPSDRTIQVVGVEPDITVENGKVPVSKHDRFTITEAALKSHLEAEVAKFNNKKIIKKSNKEKSISKEDILNDIQLKTAMDIIKVLIIDKK